MYSKAMEIAEEKRCAERVYGNDKLSQYIVVPKFAPGDEVFLVWLDECSKKPAGSKTCKECGGDGYFESKSGKKLRCNECNGEGKIQYIKYVKEWKYERKEIREIQTKVQKTHKDIQYLFTSLSWTQDEDVLFATENEAEEFVRVKNLELKN